MTNLPTIIPASEARSNFYDMLDEVSATSKRFIITKRGRAKAMILNPEEVESWEETLEIMSDKKLLKDIQEGIKDLKKKRVTPLEDVIKELNLDES